MTLLKRAAGRRFGVLAHFFARRSRAARVRALAARSRRWYDAAGQDPEFLAHLAQIDRDFDATVADGLDEGGAP